jgi:kynurenine formamidase
MTEMSAQEAHHLAGHLQPRHVGVEHQSIDTLDLERHAALEHVVDVRHAGHKRSMTSLGRLCRPAASNPTGGGREGS